MTDTTYLKEMGKKIQAIRKSKKLTVRTLGKMCDLDYGTISRIETGKFSSHILTLKNIADKLQVDVKDFL